MSDIPVINPEQIKSVKKYLNHSQHVLEQALPDVGSKAAFALKIQEIAEGTREPDEMELRVICRMLAVYLIKDIMEVME